MKFFFYLSALTVIVSGASLWAGFAYLRSEFPNVRVLQAQYPVIHYRGPKNPPLVMLQKDRPATWVGLGEVSKVAIGAVLVSEDWAFYQHKGFDANQIREAIKEDLEEGRFARGASTITQQVVRNVFLSKDKNLWRKFKELFLSVDLEQKVGKRKILETYLNIAEWGEGIFGVGEAARYYFGKTPSELTAKEGAFLAMLLPSPVRYGQSFRDKKLTDYAQDTVKSILKKMAQAKYLSDERRDQEIMVPLSFEAVPPSAL